MIDVYGIPNCDNVKKAVSWLKKHHIDHTFHDLKTEGVSSTKLEYWIGKAGMEVILNRKSTTWRNLEEAVQKRADKKIDAIQIMRDHTSIIKRPIIEKGQNVLVGFSEDSFVKYLK